MSKPFTHKKFLEILDLINPNRSWNVKSNYINANSKIKITTEFGDCDMLPAILMKGVEPTINSAVHKTEYFIKRYVLKYSNKYDFSKFQFIKASYKSTVICKTHGEFLINPNNLMSGYGCNNCGNLKISEKLLCSIENFILKANTVHNNFYSYDNSIYEKNNKCKIIITCPNHGDFNQTISDHLSGYGCKECGKIKISEAVSKIKPELRNLTGRLRSLISTSFKRKRYKRNSNSEKTLGCSWKDFKNYLENNPYNFKINCKDLDLDHIVPISSAETEKDLYSLNYYTNFQLLPRIYNQYIKRTTVFDRIHFENWLIETKYELC